MNDEPVNGGRTDEPGLMDDTGRSARGNRRARRRRKREPQPVQEGAVTGLDHEGRGVVRQDGKVVFVDDCLPGEVVRFRVRRKRASYDEAELVEVVERSPERVEPPCAHAPVCGGCRLQHLSLDGQREYKQNRLFEDLERIGGVRPDRSLSTITGTGDGTGYRRKARFAAKFVAGKGGVLVGFREKNAPFVAQIESCQTVVPAFGQRIVELRELLGALSISDRIPQLEVAAGDEDAIVVRHLEPLHETDRAKLLAFGEAHQLRMLLQSGGAETVCELDGRQPVHLHYRLEGLGRNRKDLVFRFRPTDFIQVNGGVNQDMVSRTVELLALSGGESLLDAFCGLGNFSLPVALHAGQVLGVEGDQALVEGARHNASHNGIRNARFEVGDLFQAPVCEQALAGRPERLLLDPPRSGAIALVRAVPDTGGPERIVYVSCNSATLARDAGVLVNEKGYRLDAAGLIDMFPHTAHAEAMAVFTR